METRCRIVDAACGCVNVGATRICAEVVRRVDTLCAMFRVGCVYILVEIRNSDTKTG